MQKIFYFVATEYEDLNAFDRSLSCIVNWRYIRTLGKYAYTEILDQVY